MGAVGTPKYDDAPPAKRPEKGLLGIRKAMGVFANLRPVKAYPALYEASPLKESRIKGTDMLILRELTGGLYFGSPRGVEGSGQDRHGFNTMTYSYHEIERIARMAFELARKRRNKVTSVDKANVLETSQLWRAVVIEIATGLPRRGPGPPLRGQRLHAADPPAQRLRRDPHREPVRRHHQRRGRGHRRLHRPAALGQPGRAPGRRQAAGPLRADPRLRARTSPARASPIPWAPSARWR